MLRSITGVLLIFALLLGYYFKDMYLLHLAGYLLMSLMILGIKK